MGTIAAATVLAVGLGLVNRVTDGRKPNAVGTLPAAPTTTPEMPTPPAAMGWPPRLLLDDWFITTVGEQSAGVGAMSFEGGEGALSVEWSDDAAMAEFVTTHDDETEVTTGTMLGSAVTVHRPNPTASADKQLGAASDETMVIGNADTYLSAAVVTGDRTVRAYSDELSPDDFVAAIASLRVAERSEWEATLPADIVTPAQRGAVIDPMIADVPTPDGLDVSDLRNERLIQPRHSIAFELGRAITCAWLRQWVDAAAAGDTAAATEATDALSSVDGWRPWLASGFAPEGLPHVQPDGSITVGVDGQTFDRDFVDVWCTPGVG